MKTSCFATTIVALALLAGCPSPGPAPQPPPAPPDASDAAPPADCSAACASLAAAGCPEGAPADCAEVLGRIDRGRRTRTPCGAAACPPLTCAALAAVRSPAEARALGVACVSP